MQDSQFEQLRSQAVEVITRIQDDAMHQLLEAGLPETAALEAMRRITAFGVQVLLELDALFLQIDNLVTAGSRTPEHQALFNDNAAAFFLQAQTAFATLVASTIEETIKAYRAKVAQPKKETPTITVEHRPAPQRQSPWQTLLPVLFVLGAVLGLIGWFVLWWHLSAGSLVWGVFAIGSTVFLLAVLRMTGLVFVTFVGFLFLLFFALS